MRSEAFAGFARELVATSDLTPGGGGRPLYQLPIEGLPDSRTRTSMPTIERCGRLTRPERHHVEARCTSRISRTANSGYALAHAP
jgi:hypothetical protein